MTVQNPAESGTVPAEMSRTGLPARSGAVLTALALAAVTSNINVSSANVALPSIGEAFDASQSMLNLIGLGAGLGLSITVVYAGSIADRYGRKRMLVIGLIGILLSSIASAFAPDPITLTIARLLTGIASGIAFPVTLSLITVLWAAGPRRTSAIAIWSGVSGMASVLGGALGGLLVDQLWWGSSFLMSVPLALASLLLVVFVVPAHVKESTEPVDHIGGVLSILLILALVLGINLVFIPSLLMWGLIFLGVAVALTGVFTWRQRVAPSPLFDLSVAKRRLFWAPATSGAIVFGALVGAVFVGSQFLQYVLGYSSLQAGLAGIPAAVALLVVSPASSKMISSYGTRTTSTIGFVIVLFGFVTMLFWRETTPYWLVATSFVVLGGGVSLVSAASSKALVSSIPTRRVGMASATSDLQRDLGGVILQSLLGAVLAAGFSSYTEKIISSSPNASLITGDIDQALRSSFTSAQSIAERYPQYSDAIFQAAKESMVAGSLSAYIVGGIAVIAGILIAWFGIPSRRDEQAMLEEYAAADSE